MEAYDADGAERCAYKKTESKAKHQNILQNKMEELVKIKHELKDAKDRTTESLLASRPLTDELEKLQSSLAIAKDRSSVLNAEILELESQLDAANMSIKVKVEEELKAKKMTNEITEAVNETRKELKMYKQDMKEERKARSNVKQVLRMRRQTLKTLQARLHATEMKSEAFAASAAEAVGHIKNSETDDKTSFQLTQEEYYALQERAKEETELAEWRISLFIKQQLAAEVSRNLRLSRLKELSRNKSKGKEINKDENIITEVQEQPSPIRKSALPEVQDKATNNPNQNTRKPKRGSKDRRKNDRKLSKKKKKKSVLIQVRSLVVRSISSLFR